MNFQRVWAMPCADTFDCEPIKGFVQKYLIKSKVSVDPFARNKRWATYTNDLNPNTAAGKHVDAEEFLASLVNDGIKCDLILIDPPYSPRQVKECYDSIGLPMKQTDALLGLTRKRLKSVIDKLATDDATVLFFGWNTVGMGSEWEPIEILLVCHGSDHNDTICMAERRKAKHQRNLLL
jgi:hypothetical protein